MEGQTPEEEARLFAQVWSRVLPEGSGYIVPALAPETPREASSPQPEGDWPRCMDTECQVAASCRRLWQRTGLEGFLCCAKEAEGRRRKLAAAHYLRTGVWYRPKGAGTRADDLRAVDQLLATLEGRYAQCAAMEEPLASAGTANAASCRASRRRLWALLERWGPFRV
jgi:hypothetical protein